MVQKSKIFEKTYNDYLAQIANIDIITIKDILGLTIENRGCLVHRQEVIKYTAL